MTRRPLRFRETLVPLAIAPLSGLGIISVALLWNSGNTVGERIVVPLLLAVYVYGTVAVFAVPILAIWPRSRRPSFLVAAIWGVVGVSAAFELLTGAAAFSTGRWLAPVPPPHVVRFLIPFWMGGAVSGLSYVSLIRRLTSVS